jgi:hypothetical protein
VAKSAFLNRRSKDVFIHAVVIPELEFRDIQRHVFLTDLVESADDPALEDRPEAFDGLGVDCADDVLSGSVIDNGVGVFFAEAVVPLPLIGAEQTDFGGDSFVNEAGQSGTTHVLKDAGHDVALAADCTHDGCFAGTDAACTAALATLIFVPVLGEAANEGFIDLDNSGELFKILIGERRANAMAHVPSRFIAPKAHVAVNLKGTHSLLAREHQVNDAEPLAERLIGVFEDRSDEMRETIGDALGTVHALPLERHRLQLIDVRTTAAGAMDAIWPTASDKIDLTSLFIGKHRLELGDAKLMDGFRRFGAGHGDLSFSGETVA